MADGELKVVGTTPKTGNKIDKKIIWAIIGVLVVVIGLVAGILLIKQNQDIREQASTNCPAAQQCPVPGNPNLLRNCTPPDADNTPIDSLCNAAGRIEVCGGSQYCCPSAGGSWTTNLSLCPQSTATPTSLPTATAMATATATATTTATATATATTKATATATSASSPTATATVKPTNTSTSVAKTATPTTTSTGSTATAAPTATSTSISQGPTASPVPIPETGMGWPAVVGMVAGLAIIIFSFVLAL